MMQPGIEPRSLGSLCKKKKKILRNNNTKNVNMNVKKNF